MVVIEKSLVLSAMMRSVQGTFCISIPILGTAVNLFGFFQIRMYKKCEYNEMVRNISEIHEIYLILDITK